MSDTVLAVIDLDTFPEVVAKRAAWLASLHGCALHLLLSDPLSSLLRDGLLVSNEAKEIRATIENAQLQFLDELCESLQSAHDISVAASISHERPAHEAIDALALAMEPRFVVKGTQYHSPAERATVTYTDWQLMRSLSVPLWLVKPHEWGEKPLIIAAVDPMHAEDEEGGVDRLIVNTGKSLAAAWGANLMLLHTYQRLVEIGRYAMFKFKPGKLPIEALDKNIRDAHRQKLDAFARTHQIDPKAVHQLPGPTSDILPAFARSHGAELVIMGALARSNQMQRALGSTAERVMDHLHCDILIVPGKPE